MRNSFIIIYVYFFIIIFVGCNKKETKREVIDEIPLTDSLYVIDEIPLTDSLYVIDEIPLTDSLYDIKEEYRDNIPVFPWTNGNIEKYDHFPLDKNGIPMFEYEGVLDYFPGSYIQVATTYYAKYKENKDPVIKEKFLNIANFCYENITYSKDFAVLNTKTLVKGYDLKKPWSSALVQGFAIGVMLQAYDITKDKKYLIVSQKMVRSFKYTIENGGVLSYWDRTPFYEEYADPKSHVLNGFMFSLAGLYYDYKLTGNPEAKALFFQGINSLASKINEYDALFTSNYNKLKVKDGTGKGVMETYASALNEDPDHYHELGIYQLLSIYNWTGQYVFRDYAHKFLKYDTGVVDGIYDEPKYENISASYTIDTVNYGLDHLNNELWSWGNYWSTNKPGTEIKFEFGRQRENIDAIVFYAIKKESLPKDFDVYVYKERWVKIASSSQIRKINNNSITADNGDETFIEICYLPKKEFGTALKVVFNNFRESKVIALREFNIHFDRWKELETIRKSAEKYIIQ